MPHSSGRTRKPFDESDLRSYACHMTADHFSRGGIVRLLHIPNDAFTVWLRQGLIVPIEAAAGSGKHLRFEWYEVRIAACLAVARDVGLPGEALKVISDTLRSAVKVFQRSNVPPSLLTAMLEENEHPGFHDRRLDNARENLTSAMSRGRDDIAAEWKKTILEIEAEDPSRVAKICEAARMLNEDDIDTLWLCVQLFDSEGYLMIYWDRSEEGWKARREPELSGALPAGACVLIDFASLKGLPV